MTSGSIRYVNFLKEPAQAKIFMPNYLLLGYSLNDEGPMYARPSDRLSYVGTYEETLEGLAGLVTLTSLLSPGHFRFHILSDYSPKWITYFNEEKLSEGLDKAGVKERLIEFTPISEHRNFFAKARTFDKTRNIAIVDSLEDYRKLGPSLYLLDDIAAVAAQRRFSNDRNEILANKSGMDTTYELQIKAPGNIEEIRFMVRDY